MAGCRQHDGESPYRRTTSGRPQGPHTDRSNAMPANIIVSYDGTANEDDAIALGRLLAAAGGEVSLAYVRHTHEPDSDRETLAEAEAQELLDRGIGLLGDPQAGRYAVTDRSTPEGLAALAGRLGADVIVFCSDSHTARGHVSIG